jgi:hypothetical protein
MILAAVAFAGLAVRDGALAVPPGPGLGLEPA